MQRALQSLLAVGLAVAACGGGEPLKADAGPDFTVVASNSPSFNGCNSTGDVVNYKWTVVSAPEAMAKDAGKVIREVDANCSFTLEDTMDLEELGEWVIELEVRDASGNAATDTVTVTVTQ